MNIFKIQEELIRLFDEMQENEGELIPELEEQLNITENDFKGKIESYTNYVKIIDNDLELIKNEQKRLKELYERKEKVKDRISNIVINAIHEFGDTKKSGVKFIDYGIGTVSIRKSTAVETNEGLINYVNDSMNKTLAFNKDNNQLDVINKINLEELAQNIAETAVTPITKEELEQLNMKISLNIPYKDLNNGEGYNALKEIVKYSKEYKCSTDVSKTNVKSILTENGAAMPNIARLKFNESLTIK
jgi:hypothetical protein